MAKTVDSKTIDAVLVPGINSSPSAVGGLSASGGSLAEKLEREIPSSGVPARLGLWIDAGFQIYYSRFKTLAILAAIGVGLGVVTFGFAVPVLAAVMAVIVLREMKASVPNAGLKVTPLICLHGLAIMVVQNVLAYSGGYFLEMVPYVSGFALAAWAIAIETLFAFALLFVVAFELPAWSAVGRSFSLASKAGLSLLWLYVMGAAASKVGGVLFGVGAILTAPILICVLAAAFVSLTAKQDDVVAA